ncbi:MAG: hypothetical protein GPJ54_03805 [Candidatus Heimdallarchaeota archaeon]|nr:hypothetical protein [Candidatus Heimdallarchaeota archaeon]
MVNPLGEESDSVFAWRERYKAKEFEVQTLQMRVGELKGLLDKSVEDYQLQNQDIVALRSELSKTKEELANITTTLSDKKGVLENLEQSLETESMATLKAENKRFREEMEDLQGQLARGGGGQIDTSSDLSTTLTPLMLKIFDPKSTQFDDAFNKFIKSIIQSGDVFQKIIATLIDKGGSSSIEKAKATVNSDEFDNAIDYLIENEILKIVDFQLMIQTSDTLVSPDKNWDELEISEVFDLMKNIMEQESDANVVRSIDMFRDTLQERENVPAKIFFEIRKMSEGIANKSLTRQEGIEQIDDWLRRVGIV